MSPIKLQYNATSRRAERRSSASAPCMRWAVSADAAEGSGFRVKGLRFKDFRIVVRVQGLGL